MTPSLSAAHVFLLKKPSDTPFVCSIPHALEKNLFIGCAVIVKMNQKEWTGLVTSIQNTRTRGIAEIVKVFNKSISGLSESLVKLGLWAAEYYLAYPSHVFQAMLPSFARVAPTEIVSLKPFELKDLNAKIPVKTDLRRKIISELTKSPSLTIKQLERRTNTSHLRQTLLVLEQTGWITIQEFYKLPKLKTKKAFKLAISYDEAKKRLSTLRGEKQRKALECILKMHREKTNIIFRDDEIGETINILDALKKKGILSSILTEVVREPKNLFSEKSHPQTLSEKQREVVNTVTKTIEKNAFKTFLLYGVTGSGKTNVYIEIIKQVLAKGKTAIMLVPEISLTPQTAARFKSVFHKKVKVMHSQMSLGERYDAWRSFRSGEAKVSLGVRSSIFVPLENVGAIIVDEEHDASYKQDKHPSYHTRDCAVMRSKIENAVCILGSATPSFESFHNAQNGKYELLKLSQRVSGAKPDIKLISLSKELMVTNSISKTLHEEISKRLHQQEQVILLQNRRGFSGYVQCTGCGHVPTCKNCHVSMTYHAEKNVLKCHYCGYEVSWKTTCFACHSKNMKLNSPGTEQITYSLEKLFQDYRVFRMDSDATSLKNAHAKILNKFKENHGSILLGTQMISKGLDFPNVTLVGAIEADASFFLPDFRSSERAFSLLFQMAGRAGRGNKKGEVLLQSYNIKNPAYFYILNHDYDSFFHFEMKSRKFLHFPPYSRLLKIQFASTIEDNVIEASEETASFLNKKFGSKDIEFTEAIPALITKLKGVYRYHILIKQKNNTLFKKKMWRQTQKALRASWQARKVKTFIDVDAHSIL